MLARPTIKQVAYHKLDANKWLRQGGRERKGEQGEVEAVLDHRRGARSEGGTGAVIRGRLRTRSRAADDVIGRMGMDANVRNGVSEGQRKCKASFTTTQSPR